MCSTHLSCNLSNCVGRPGDSRNGRADLFTVGPNCRATWFATGADVEGFLKFYTPRNKHRPPAFLRSEAAAIETATVSLEEL